MNWFIEHKYLAIYLYGVVVHFFAMIVNMRDKLDFFAYLTICWFWPIIIPARLLRKLIKYDIL